jgi:formate transporter
MTEELQIDTFPSVKLASRMEEVGADKLGLRAATVFALALLGGVFVGLGAVFSSAVTTGLAAAGTGEGLIRLLGGLAFCLGIVAVVLAGAELFAGNNLIVMAFAGSRATLPQLLRNWGIVFAGNLAGALLVAGVLLLTRQWSFSGGAFGANALAIAEAKCGLDFSQSLLLGVLAGILISLALWLAFPARTVTDKVLAVAFPITAFVAAGFEFAIANLYFIPVGLVIRAWAGPEFWSAIGQTAADFPHLTWARFLLGNLLPVTLGNVLGGAVFVGLAYWLIRLRPQKVVDLKPKKAKEPRVPNILVVDDDPDFVEVTSMILEKEGYAISTAYNGREAWDSMMRKKPDMVLLDVMMSTTLEGVDLSRRMSADPHLKDVPIIMISSIDSTYHAGKLPDSIHIPIDAWLSKPVNPDLLLKTVRRFLV